jgi:endonuclease/exonuclease/phosphatase family metal-dependent hydrolase
MSTKARRLLTALVLLGVLAAVEYTTGVDLLDLAAREDAAQPVATVTDAFPAPVEGSQLRLVTWNLYNFGRSKDDREIAFIAEVVRGADLVAVQEVSTGPAGAQAVARLDAALDRTGFAWDYRISDPTTGDGTERYAFLWKPSRVRLVGRPWLEETLAERIDREPFCARFEQRSTGERVLVASLHAVPRSKDPETEIALLDELHRRYADDHVALLGDFNLDGADEAFGGLRRAGYRAVLTGQATSLRRKRRDEPEGHLANPYDNIFYETAPLRVGRAGVVDFTTAFEGLRDARRISDHLPVYVDLDWAPAPAGP